jgi:molecular chaperone HtpG
MKAVAEKASLYPQRQSVDADSIRIGKDIIEILTSGMYTSPVTIYREYIQNAIDSIDMARSHGLLTERQHGKVSIAFDHHARSVTIRDAGLGISRRNAVPILLAMGASPKRGTQARGFRGVGRLSGLAYCRELEFRTKAHGENKIASVTWNCRALRERLADNAFRGDLRRIVSDVVSVSYERSEDAADHFFEVRLKDIARLRNDLLLNERAVSHYLAQVGPVPFAPEFSFGAAIEQRLAANSPRIPIDLTVAGEPVYRPYRDEIAFPTTSHKVRIDGIEFLEFADVDGGTGAIGWLAHHDYVRSLPYTLGIRGVRARMGDLQIGESTLFDDAFKESRFNGWSIGEVHVFDRRIVPNARRDNFEINHHYYNLLVQLGPVAARITQQCRSASLSRNATQSVRSVIAEVGARLKQKQSFDRAELSRLKSAVLRARTKAKKITQPELRDQLEKRLDRYKAALAKANPKRGAAVVAFDEAESLVSRVITNREQANKLIEALRRLCS